jgi:hypothetical protein
MNDASQRAPQPSDADEGADAPPRRSRAKVLLWATGSVAATAIGIASIVVPLVSDSQRRTTSTDTLVIDPTSEPVAAGLPTSGPVADAVDVGFASSEVEQDTMSGPGMDVSFAVPIDAPWSTFPDDGGQQGPGCSQAQYDWLVTHQVPDATQGGLFDFLNNATDGGALSIRSIRAEGAFARQEPARVVVHCEGNGTGAGDDYTIVKVTLGVDEPGTVLASSVLPIGSPFSRDLAPGEVGQVMVLLATSDPEQDFEGRIVADVVAGEQERTVTIEEGVLWRSAPAIRAGAVNISWDGVLQCVDVPVTSPLFEGSDWGGPYTTMPQYYDTFPSTACSPADLGAWIKGLSVEY